MSEESRGAPLTGMRVLALGQSAATRVAAGWLADCGADVVAMRPGWRPPTANTSESLFEHQTSAVRDVTDLAGEAPFVAVIATTAELAELRERLPGALAEGATVVEITSPLPQPASFDDALIGDMRLWARSGLGFLTREIGADWQLGTPCVPRNRQASLLTGITAGIAAVAASMAEPVDAGVPRHIAVDQLEMLALLPMQPIAFAQLADRIVGRGPAVKFPGGTMPTADGMAYVRPVEPAQWARLLQVIGNLDAIAERVEADPTVLREQADPIDQRIRAWASALRSTEVADLSQAEHVPVAPVLRPEEVVNDAHLGARGFFRSSGSQRSLNLPWLATVGEAPQHVAERRDTAALRHDPGNSGSLPLAGLRVLDLSWAWAGPFAATLLADLGAEVINVEWHPRVSNLRRNAPFAGNRSESNNTAAWWSANQRGKLSIGVNLKTEGGRRVVRDLAALSDVVVENFSPGVVDRLGVGFTDLVEVNPSIVYVSLSAFGQSGPRSHYVGYGVQVYAASGASYATSQDDTTLSQMYIPYPDPVSGLIGAFAMATHVRHARATGRPARVDVSELEAMASVALEPLLAALDGGAVREEAGYLVAATADDRFVLLIARDATQWPAFAHALDAAGSAAEDLCAAASTRPADEIVERAANAGLVAEPIRDSGEVLRDAYLADRGFWVADQSPEVAPSGARIGAPLWHVDRRRAQIWRGAPPLFSDTRTVLEDLLGYPAAAVDDLRSAGAIE